MEDRVRAAIDEIRPLLESHGGGIDFVKIEGATVFVRLRGACNGCPGALMTLKQGSSGVSRNWCPRWSRSRRSGKTGPLLARRRGALLDP
jgi:Fe-S cluster biogenesis protein NfuA